MLSDEEKIQRNKVVTDKATLLNNTVTYQNNSSTIEQSRLKFFLEWQDLVQLLKYAENQRRNCTLTQTPEVIAGWKTR